MEFILLVALIIFFIYFQNKINGLEKLIRSIKENNLYENSLNQTQTTSNLNTDTSIQDIKILQTSTDSGLPKTSPSTDYLSLLLSWLAKDWILKIGAFFILLGFIWLVSYAFISGLIGEQARILLGLVCGTLILLFGNFKIKKIKEQGVIFEVLGAGIVIVTVYSAQFFYNMFTTPVALLLILLIVFLTSFSAIKFNSISLIVISLFIAFLSPFLVGESSPNFINLLWYILVVCVSSVWITFYKNWKFIPIICATFTLLYSFLAFGEFRLATLPLADLTWFRFFALSFVSLYFFSSISLLLFSNKHQTTDYLSSTIVSVLSCFYIFKLVPKDLQSMFLLLTSILLICGAYYVYKKVGGLNVNIIKSYSVASCLLLLVASFTEFSGAELLIVLSIEAFLVPLTLSKSFNEKSPHYFMVFSVPVVYASLGQLYYVMREISLKNQYGVIRYGEKVLHSDISIFNINVISLFIAVIYFLFVSFYFYFDIKTNKMSLVSSKIYSIFLGVYIIIFNWLFVDILFSNSNITSIVNLILISVAGLILYFTGVSKLSSYLKNYGIVLLVLVVIRLLGYEVWQMDTIIYRIVVFFGVGIVFILSVLLPKKLLTK